MVGLGSWRRPSRGDTDFQALFGRPPTVRADAPGRVNLIGEHTDYNGGLVLPTAIPQRSFVELAPREDGQVRVASANVEDRTEVHAYHLGAETPGRGWLDYVQGCTAVLRGAGHPLRGFEARISSTVPIGSGVSSSAALEVSVLRALRAAFALALDDVAIALAGHRAENDFVGARVGVMDQMASSLADELTALFLDTRSLEHERVRIPAGVDLAVIDSGIAHSHATGGYNARRAECERACALLEVAQLRDLDPTDLQSIRRLPAPLAQRVRHVVMENERVRRTVEALRAGELATLGQLLYASHDSLRDDYQVSVPEIDLIVELARDHDDVYGARLTGGGFGGAIVLLARRGTGAGAAERIAATYRSRTGIPAAILVAGRPASGG